MELEVAGLHRAVVESYISRASLPHSNNPLTPGWIVKQDYSVPHVNCTDGTVGYGLELNTPAFDSRQGIAEIGRVLNKLDDLGAVYGLKRIPYEACECTGLHVHVSRWNMDYIQLAYFYAAWYALEDLMYTFVPEHRQSDWSPSAASSIEGAFQINNDPTFQQMIDSIPDGGDELRLAIDNLGYLRRNTASLRGRTIEFRQAVMTNDIEWIQAWTTVLVGLVNAARRKGVPPWATRHEVTTDDLKEFLLAESNLRDRELVVPSAIRKLIDGPSDRMHWFGYGHNNEADRRMLLAND
jgi:hypothetical protein